MSNQRKGNWKPATMNDTEKLDVRKVISLMKDCATETDGDVSFYFEQVADYFQNQYRPRKGLDSAQRVLGL